MRGSTALLTFSIGPVHSFIAQARRVADLWAGSELLSDLISVAMETAKRGGTIVFPYSVAGTTSGLPNRFVCRVPADIATAMASRMEASVRARWRHLTRRTTVLLRRSALIKVAESLQSSGADNETWSQVEALLDISWSWVSEHGDYAKAAALGAARYAASREFRPFRQVAELGEKCAICGERTALPNGNRDEVKRAWENAEKRVSKDKTRQRHRGFYRWDQTRFCLVCATKRFYPILAGRKASFLSFESFEPPRPPSPSEQTSARLEPLQGSSSDDRRVPYVAIVNMDGDQFGKLLGLPEDRLGGLPLEEFHRKISKALTGFATDLRDTAPGRVRLNLDDVKLKGQRPQLIYAGGEDVLFVCDPRDAIPLARAIREKFLAVFKELEQRIARRGERPTFTISGAVVFAHTKHPAGLTFREAERLLKEKAKGEADRDALAIRLEKRSGPAVEVAFKWQNSLLETLLALVKSLSRSDEAAASGGLASRQSYNLTNEESLLRNVFGNDRAHWLKWLTEKLSRGERSAEHAKRLAELIAPFFVEEKTEALRIARFLATEVGTDGQ